MAQQGLFSETRAIYWPAEYSDLVNMLKGQDSAGQASHQAMYRYNTGAVVLAAVVGLIHKRDLNLRPSGYEANLAMPEK